MIALLKPDCLYDEMRDKINDVIMTINNMRGEENVLEDNPNDLPMKFGQPTNFTPIITQAEFDQAIEGAAANERRHWRMKLVGLKAKLSSLEINTNEGVIAHIEAILIKDENDRAEREARKKIINSTVQL